ncbi:SMP-30/gluconolactonase/LRE family protein [Candidatus Uabimicrobium sp. HlEnr_7]|uniref:SMP-30/gluconolactonase/LRE family protein n=1 Tax=Candidatus Uabimicrobium helgolandensis TaxID=3095367 RepID=UPI0035575E13
MKASWKKKIAITLGILGFVITICLVFVKILYGGGTFYPSVNTTPIKQNSLKVLTELPYPPGMVASSQEGRLFFNYHMLHKPERFSQATLFEFVDGKKVPFPNIETQDKFYHAMGITVDHHQRLWVTIPRGLDGKQPSKLLAIDINTKEIVFEHQFKEGVGIFAQDLRVSLDGKTVYLADCGFLPLAVPSLIVLDIESKSSRVLLKDHSTLAPQNWLIQRQDGKPHQLFFGLLSFKVGFDGLAVSKDGHWLYMAAMSHDTVYRVPTRVLTDKNLDDEKISSFIEEVGKKPLSDGIELDKDNNLIITDVEYGSLAILTPEGKLNTLVQDKQINWSDSITIANDGTIYFTDSRLTDLINTLAQPASKEKIIANGPYKIYKVLP